MAEARPPPGRSLPGRPLLAGSPPLGLPPAGSPPSPASAFASQWLAFKHLPRAVPQAPKTKNLQPNPDNCTFVPFTQAVPVQVDMAMALHRVRIAEKYGKNYLCLLQAVFLAGEYHFPVHSQWPGTPALSSSQLPLVPPQPVGVCVCVWCVCMS